MSTLAIFRRFCQATIRCPVVVVLFALAWSPLAFGGEIHDAAKNGDLEMVKALIKENPDLVFSKDTNGFTPLHWSALYGRQNVAELLLTSKADVNAKDNHGNTPLHSAVGHGDVVKLLLANKADVNAKDNEGRTPLDLASANQSRLADEVNVNTMLTLHTPMSAFLADLSHKQELETPKALEEVMELLKARTTALNKLN